jgi:hypothetical protein
MSNIDSGGVGYFYWYSLNGGAVGTVLPVTSS